MKSNNKKMAILAGVVVLSGPALARDITLFDNQGPGWGSPVSTWGTQGGVGPTGHDSVVKEDNETEPGTISGQVWDLEAMIWNTSTKWNNTTKSWDAHSGKTMGILGGYNMVTGQGEFNPGDIFIDVDGTPNAPTPLETNGYHTIANSMGYDYVIHFNSFGNSSTAALRTTGIGGGSFTVYQLSAASTLMSVKFSSLSQSNPWRYVSGAVATVTTGTVNWYSGINDAQAMAIVAGSGGDATGPGSRTIRGDGAGGPSHHYLEVPMDWVSSIGLSSIGGHVTMGCGNDELVGLTGVPDGGTTLALFGTGMAGLLLFRRNARRS